MTTVDFYGLRIAVICPEDSLLSLACLRPFAYLQKVESPAADYRIIIRIQAPDYNAFPRLAANFVTPRNAVFKDGLRKIIDYGGKAVVIETPRQSSYEIESLDRDWIREICYSIFLSLMGQHCDRMGMLRIHAMSVSTDESAIVMLTPSGGGKSTMLFELLKSHDFKLIAEDITLVNRDGFVLPNPMPVGTENPSQISGIPEQFIWKQKRIEPGEKYRVDLEYWNRPIETKPMQKKVFLCAERLLSGDPKIVRLSFFDAMRYLLRDAVIGMGVYQGLEFLLSRSSLDLIKRVPYLFRRFFMALKLCANSPFYRFYLSRDTQANVDCLRNFVKGQCERAKLFPEDIVCGNTEEIGLTRKKAGVLPG